MTHTTSHTKILQNVYSKILFMSCERTVISAVDEELRVYLRAYSTLIMMKTVQDNY